MWWRREEGGGWISLSSFVMLLHGAEGGVEMTVAKIERSIKT
jgi:hypothetical protein